MIWEKTISQFLIGLLFTAILILLFIGIYNKSSPSMPITQTYATVAKIGIALENYKAKNGEYPEGENKDIIKGIVDKGEIGRLSLDKNGACIDVWGTPLKIFSKDGKMIIVSAGPNKKFDEINSPEDDDIRNY